MPVHRRSGGFPGRLSLAARFGNAYSVFIQIARDCRALSAHNRDSFTQFSGFLQFKDEQATYSMSRE